MLASPFLRVGPYYHGDDQSGVTKVGTYLRQDGMADHTSKGPANKRPKLSLQTSLLPITYGKSSTALTVTASAVDTATPTGLNTFSNAYSIPLRPSPDPNTASPSGFRLATPHSRTASPILSRKTSQPYALNLPLGLKSILRNSPIPTVLRRSTNSASPATTRRVFFPNAKKVHFRSSGELEEVIRTTRFVAAHSDLSSSEKDQAGGTDVEPTDDLEEDNDDTGSTDEDVVVADLSTSRKRKGAGGVSRQVEAVELREGRASVRVRKYSSRRKRRRWEWTLGPVAEGEGAANVAVDDQKDLQVTGAEADAGDNVVENISTLLQVETEATDLLFTEAAMTALPASPEDGRVVENAEVRS